MPREKYIGKQNGINTIEEKNNDGKHKSMREKAKKHNEKLTNTRPIIFKKKSKK